MDALLQMLSGPGARSGGVQEDALMAVSTLTEVMGDKFIKYMESFLPYLLVGLQNVVEHTVIVYSHFVNLNSIIAFILFLFFSKPGMLGCCWSEWGHLSILRSASCSIL